LWSCLVTQGLSRDVTYNQCHFVETLYNCVFIRLPQDNVVKGEAIPHVSYSREGHTSFPEFFNENFCDVAFHFSYRLSFSFHLL